MTVSDRCLYCRYVKSGQIIPPFSSLVQCFLRLLKDLNSIKKKKMVQGFPELFVLSVCEAAQVLKPLGLLWNLTWIFHWLTAFDLSESGVQHVSFQVTVQV